MAEFARAELVGAVRRARRATWCGVAALSLGLVGCGDDGATTDTAESAAPTTTVPTVAAVASAGCDLDPTPVDPAARQALTVGGVERWYRISVPELEGDRGEPRPLVIDFHGLAEGADIHTVMSRANELGEREGFITVTPQGTGDTVAWATAPSGAAGPDDQNDNPDLRYVTAMLDEVEARHCVDTTRVYAMGLSNGAMMSSMLACKMSDRIAAVAPVSGIAAYEPCASERAVPAVAFHGTADPILFFDGGVGDVGGIIAGARAGAVLDRDQASAPVSTPDPTATTTDEFPPGSPTPADVSKELSGPGYPAYAAAWAARNGCGPTPADTFVSVEVVHRVYDCPQGASVEMYIIRGGGHSWPGSEFSRSIGGIVGPTTFDISATEVAWEFFQRFRLPS